MPLGKKDGIRIPNLFLKNKECKLSVVRGVFDTDGCIYLEKKNGKLYPRVIIRTTSAELADQIKDIFKDFGMRATSYVTKRRNKNWKSLISVEVRGIKESKKFFNIFEPHNPKHNMRFKTLTIGETDNREAVSSNLIVPTQ